MCSHINYRIMIESASHVRLTKINFRRRQNRGMGLMETLSNPSSIHPAQWQNEFVMTATCSFL